MGLGSKDDGTDGAHALPGHGGDASVMTPRTYRREVLGHTEEEEEIILHRSVSYSTPSPWHELIPHCDKMTSQTRQVGTEANQNCTANGKTVAC